MGSNLITSSSSRVGGVPAKATKFKFLVRKGDFRNPDTITAEDVQTRFDYIGNKDSNTTEFPCINGDLTKLNFERFEKDFKNWFSANYAR